MPITIPFGQDYGQFHRWISEITAYGRNTVHQLRAVSVPFGSTPSNFPARVVEPLNIPEPQIQDLCDRLRLLCYQGFNGLPILTSIFTAIWEPVVAYELVPDEASLATAVPGRPDLPVMHDRIVTPRYTFDVEDVRYFHPRSLARVLWDMPYALGAEMLSRMLVAEDQARTTWSGQTLLTFGQYRHPKLSVCGDAYTLEMYAWLYSGGVVYT